MIEIDNTLIGDEVLQKEFVCNLSKCKGICCVEGDAGAPLEVDELEILDSIYPTLEPYLSEKGKKAIAQLGNYVKDEDDEWVTPLVEGKECAYVVFEKDGTSKCAIENAYREGVIDFPKPISCHLYPIRVTKYRSFTAVNYHAWDICSDACELGKELQVTVADFVKEPLIRKFGVEWYEKLIFAKESIQK